VSGHACQEELKMMYALVKPKFFIPVHGERRMLFKSAEMIRAMGHEAKNVVISENGRPIELTQKTAKLGEPVPAGKVLVDGMGVGDVGSVVLRDRKHLAQDGLIVVVATVDLDEATIVSGPDLISRGFVYVRESEELMDDVRELVRGVLADMLDAGVTEWTQMKTNVKDALSKYLYQKTKRKPMILPVIMNV